MTNPFESQGAKAPAKPYTASQGRREIRSFVLRQGRFTPAQQRAFDLLWPRFGVDYTGTLREQGYSAQEVDAVIALRPASRSAAGSAPLRAAATMVMARVRACSQVSTVLGPRLIRRERRPARYWTT